MASTDSINVTFSPPGEVWSNCYGTALCHVTEPDQIAGYVDVCFERPIGSVRRTDKRLRPVNFCAKHELTIIDAIMSGQILR